MKDSILVGIPSTTTFNSALRYAKRIKEAIKDVFIILVGFHVSFEPEKALKNDYVDAVCICEGEETILEVAENGEIKKNEPRSFIQDLDSLPFPAYELMSLRKYSVFG